MTTASPSSVDVHNGQRPLLTAVVLDGINQVSLPLPATGSTIRLEGFDGNEMVAALRLTIG